MAQSMSTTHGTKTNAGHVDIGVDRVAKVYAQAIIEAADAAGCRREVLGELGSLAREVLPKVLVELMTFRPGMV